MPPLTTSRAEPDDIPSIAILLEEMDRFYGATTFSPLEDRLAAIKTNLFEENLGIHLMLARKNNEVVGLASYSFLWPAVGVTRSLYLKELYVSKLHRRQGIGNLLMKTLMEVAVENDCSRLEWTTDLENEDAQHFYRQFGSNQLSTKAFYRLTDFRQTSRAINHPH
ncbi:hypothetical protein GCM10027290_11990 [Micromonospora sonneratiae]|uniref:GNAT family N-acetyltransferase n=1 Tax=Micromonospora sonneratiae TaxID=1184706 RepID=A0ABW3YGE6_9ACTN